MLLLLLPPPPPPVLINIAVIGIAAMAVATKERGGGRRRPTPKKAEALVGTGRLVAKDNGTHEKGAKSRMSTTTVGQPIAKVGHVRR